MPKERSEGRGGQGSEVRRSDGRAVEEKSLDEKVRTSGNSEGERSGARTSQRGEGEGRSGEREGSGQGSWGGGSYSRCCIL